MIKKLIDEKRTRVVVKSDCFKRQIHYDFNIYEADSMRKITNELEILPSNSQIIVERVPISFSEVTYYSQPQQKLDYKTMKGGTKK